MAKIRARCRACRFDFYLAEFVRATFLEDHCPNCGRPLADDAPVMRQYAGRMIVAHDRLLESVRVLVDLPGNLELVPHTLVRELLDEVNRGHEIAGDRDLIRREIEELERYAQAWAKLAGEEEETERARMGEGLGRMAALLSGLADRLKARDQGSKQATDVESAATQVEALAKSMAERRPAEDAVAEALDSARRSLDHQPDEEE